MTVSRGRRAALAAGMAAALAVAIAAAVLIGTSGPPAARRRLAPPGR
jgi:hypothetical protein